MTMFLHPRMPRMPYLMSLLVAWPVFFLVRSLAVFGRLPLLDLAWSAAMVVLLAVLSIARLRDRNRHPAWLLAAAVPLLGAAWLAWELCLCRGTRGANRYGPDPLATPH